MDKIYVLGAAAALCGCAICPALAASDDRIRESRCIEDIHQAVASGSNQGVSADCWRIGPVSLNMTRNDTETALGAADHVVTYTNVPGDGGIAGVVAFYIFPNDLRRQLMRHPRSLDKVLAQMSNLALVYRNDRVSQISLGRGGAIITPPCTPTAHKSATERAEVVANSKPPYTFNSVALGDRLDSVAKKFGPFESTNRSHDFFRYLTVPLSIDSSDSEQVQKVDGLTIANGARSPNYGTMLYLVASLDSATCLVNGYTFSDHVP